MCRLFGMSGAPHQVQATFWLLYAPESMRAQSLEQPDGTGLGYFDSSRPAVHKTALAAHRDRDFSALARTVRSTTFIAHVRWATTGKVKKENSHPFAQADRLFAHNGTIRDKEKLERRLGRALSLVQGDTDSERYFALITKEIEQNGGDVPAGIAGAVNWIVRNLDFDSLNFVLTTRDELWALRYPGKCDLFVLDREPGNRHGNAELDAESSNGALRVKSQELIEAASLLVATEEINVNPRWRLLDPGCLLYVNRELGQTTTLLVS